MKKLFFLAMGIGFTCWCPYAGAQEEDRSGVSISALLGGCFCVENGDANCNQIDPSFGFSASLGYRIMKHLGVGLDFAYGMYDTPGFDVSVMGLTAGPVLYVPLDRLDLFAGLGLGWMRLNIEVENVEGNADGFGLALQAGLEYRIVKSLGLGVMFKFHFNFADELCGEGECADINDVAHNAMVGARISVYFQ